MFVSGQRNLGTNGTWVVLDLELLSQAHRATILSPSIFFLVLGYVGQRRAELLLQRLVREGSP